MKVVKIVLGVLGALGLGLVGLILACHFNPGLSDSIAEKLYRKDKITAQENASDESGEDLANENGLVNDNEDPSKLLNEDGTPVDAGEPVMQVSTAESQGDGDVVMVPADFKSLEDYGFTQENVIDNISDYFEDCFQQLSKGKGENTSFYNVVRDSRLAEEVLASYDNESYRKGFMDQFMDDYKIATCGWNVDVEELQAGYFLISHSYEKGEDIPEEQPGQE